MSFIRSGAARTVLVIVLWRHSPAIPIAPSSRMKMPVKSPANAARTSSSVKSPASSVLSTSSSSEIASPDPISAKNVRVVRSLSSSACRSALMASGPRSGP